MRSNAEYECKLDAQPGFRLPPLGGRALEPRYFTSTYYDVPGGSLAAAEITLRRRVERGHGLWQLKLPSQEARLELEAEGERAGPPEEILGLLRAHLRHGPLEPIAELRTRRKGELVARGGTTAEVTVDEVAVMDARRVLEEFVEVELELRAGNPKQLEGLVDELAAVGAQPGSGVPKLFRALGREARGDTPARTPFEALRRRLLEQLREIERHDPGTRLDRDPESLHDMRVAVRRLRALSRAGKKLVATNMGELTGRLKELGGELGEVRDLDVLLEHLEVEAAVLDGGDAGAAEKALAALRRERSRKRRRLLRTLDSDAYLALLDDARQTVEKLEPSDAEISLNQLAAAAARKLRKAVKALPEEPTDAELHELRKIGKRTRYAAELAEQGKVVRAAKRLQGVLGTHQDAVVATERLRQLVAEAPPIQALAVGRLLERERGRRAAARGAWPKKWKRLRKAI